ncbi:hypothetical protein KIL84_020669 [Mauremys mutica]|uniref:Uncharacterized protein n=1 Tax=Mauremys mutica TaxID=74926 RepID=A0A9D4B0T9_9SAUR|nr:hypothetical protein KIL84_020669 [Mauremys mutica]
MLDQLSGPSSVPPPLQTNARDPSSPEFPCHPGSDLLAALCATAPALPLQVMIREKNPDGYLSAAEIPLIKLYLVMSACFLAAATVWVYFLCQHK